MQRLFVAIELPETVRRSPTERQTGLPGMRWVSPDNLHLTIRFIGEVPLAQAASIKAALKTVRAESLSLQVKGLGFFDRRPQAVLWAGVEPSAERFELKRQIDTVLERHAGLKAVKGRFSPHITLGRMKQADRKVLQAFMVKNKTAGSTVFTAEAFTLFSSVLAPGGAVHTVEERYPLMQTRPTRPENS